MSDESIFREGRKDPDVFESDLDLQLKMRPQFHENLSTADTPLMNSQVGKSY